MAVVSVDEVDPSVVVVVVEPELWVFEFVTGGGVGLLVLSPK